jgi:serine/threonine protein phosphatase PrpC
MGGSLKSSKSRWKLTVTSVIGKQHEESDGRCEDAWEYKRCAISNGHEILAVCLSDGAGSANNGWVGAHIVTRTLANWLVENFDFLFSSEVSSSNKIITSMLKRNLRKAAFKSRTSIKSYACTLLAVVVASDGRWATIHIGDGAIVAQVNGFLELISAPRKGEYANETFFVTDKDSINNTVIKLSPFQEEKNFVDAFALFTDGVESSLVNRHTGEISKVISDMFKWLDHNEEEEVTRAIERNLRMIFRTRTGDDCSLAIIKWI